MPYTVSNPPKWLKNLPKGAISIGVRTFNRVLKETGDEDQARQAAWRNIKIKYRKVGDKWVPRVSSSEKGVELSFYAAVHELKTGEEKHLATFYVMNTSLNRNKWQVTDQALDAALPTLLNKALNCIPGYRVNHVHEPLQVGRWISADKPDGYALATAEITDGVAWEKVTSGEWGPVSVKISAYRVVCSECGEDITAAPCEHIEAGTGHDVIESFTFNQVDFVGIPAYPQAGFLTLDRLAEAKESRVRIASYLDQEWSKNGLNLDQSQSKRQAAGSPGQDPESRRKEKKMSEELEALKQSFETLRTDYNTLKAEYETEKAENSSLKERVESMETRRHQEILSAAVEARKKAGLAEDNEAEKLKDYSDDVLILLTAEANRVAEKIKPSKQTGPKLTYSNEEEVTEFEAACKSMRGALGIEGLRERE